jgi:hypothetical protein
MQGWAFVFAFSQRISMQFLKIVILFQLIAASFAAAITITLVHAPSDDSNLLAGRVLGFEHHHNHKAFRIYSYFLFNETSWISGPTMHLDAKGSYSYEPLSVHNCQLLRLYLSPSILPHYQFGKWNHDDFRGAIASVSHSPGGQYLTFAGYDTWYTKAGKGMGPGPNDWSRDPAAIWVDSAGMHLTVQKLKNSWVCTEAVLQGHYFGHGMYYWVIKGQFALLDKQIVVGVFTYDLDEASAPGYGEIDFEISKWGDPRMNKLLSFTVHPYPDGDDKAHVEYNIGKNELFTLVLNWQPGITEQWAFNRFLTFEQATSAQFQTPYHWKYSGPNAQMPPKTAEVRLNLWNLQGIPPSGPAKRCEFVVVDFQFAEW